MFVEDQNGHILECNASALEMFGYSREEILRLRGRDLFPEEVAETFPAYLDEVNTTGGIFVWISSRKKNGTIFPALYSTQVVFLDGVLHILAIIRRSGDRYYFLNPVTSSPNSSSGITAEYPDLSLTWEKRDTSLILVGYDDRTVESTKNLIRDFIGRSAQDLYKTRQDIVSDLDRCFQDRTVLRRRTIYKFFTTGEECIAEITYTFVHPNIVIMYLEDFTERDAAEVLNRSFVRGSPVGLCLIQNGRIRFVNPKLREYTGYEEEQLLRKDPLSLIHPDDRRAVSDILTREHVMDLPSTPFEFRILTRMKECRWVMMTFTSIFYLRAQALLINLLDITELKSARERLDELTSLQSSIMASMPHAVIGLDNGRIVFSNHAVETVFGWTPEEITGRTMRFLFQDRERYTNEAMELSRQLVTNDRYSKECTYKRKDGTEVVCFTSVSRMSGRADDRRIVATLTDISEKKKADESLKESQRILSTLMGNLPGMAYRCLNDKNWTMEFVSEGSYALTGYKPAELINNSRVSYGDLIHPDDRQAVWEYVQYSLGHRERFQIMYRIVTSEGRLKWVWEKGMGIYNPAGRLLVMEGFISDITERKIAEEQLRRSRRQLRIHAEHLHSVLEGERAMIAREVHDELGQILTALKMDLFWVDKRIPGDMKEIHGKVGSMIDHIDVTIKTVERILMELRPGLLEDLGLTPAIEWQAEEFQRRTGIICDAILDPDPERLISDTKVSTAVFRICQEALTNIARHAQATKVEITLNLTEALLELIVCDNGKGITFKDIKKSESFGILGIRERVNLLGGKVTIAGRKGKGTTLRVRLPIRTSCHS